MKKKIKIIMAVIMIAAVSCAAVLPAAAWGNNLGDNDYGPDDGINIYSRWSMTDLSYIKMTPSSGPTKVNQATLNMINVRNKGTSEPTFPQEQTSGVTRITVNEPTTAGNVSVTYTVSARLQGDVTQSVAFSAEFRDLFFKILPGMPGFALSELPKFEYEVSCQNPWSGGTTCYAYDMSGTCYNVNGEKLYDFSYDNELCEVARLDIDQDDYYSSLNISPFKAFIRELPSSVGFVWIDRVYVYPTDYHAFEAAQHNPEYRIRLPYYTDVSKISNGKVALEKLAALQDKDADYWTEQLALKDAELEAKDDEILALEQENFELQNVNALDEVFTGLSSSIWNGIGEISDLGYSYTDSSGTLQKVTIGGLITVAVVGIVAIVVIKLVRGG